MWSFLRHFHSPRQRRLQWPSLASEKSTCMHSCLETGITFDLYHGLKQNNGETCNHCLMVPSVHSSSLCSYPGSAHTELPILGRQELGKWGCRRENLVVNAVQAPELWQRSLSSHHFTSQSWAPNATANNCKMILSCCRCPIQLLYKANMIFYWNVHQ